MDFSLGTARDYACHVTERRYEPPFVSEKRNGGFMELS